MKRVASLFLPMLPIERFRRLDRLGRSAPPPDRPLVTAERQGQRMAIAAVCPLARSAGLHVDMPLTQARALVPGLDIRPAEPEAETAVLTSLALLAARCWTPSAAVDPPDGLWLDINGAAHLFGGERQLCERIVRTCRRAGFTARIAVAGTTGAAHALARFGAEDIALCFNEGEEIAAFPPEALRIEEEAANACRRFGIDSVGELAAMPRGPLARRFGQGLLMRLDQALGRTAETFEPIVPHKPPAAILRFLEPILSADAIERVIGDLASMLAVSLERQGLGARRVKLLCDRVDGDEQAIVIGLASATRDSAHLSSLLKMKVEQIEPGFGIEAMRLIAVRSEPLSGRQIASFEFEEDSGADLPPLVDRIAGRIGADHVFRMSAVESDVPERSVRRVDPLAQAVDWPHGWARPARLLPRPERVDKVIAELPDQPPLRFSWRGETHRVRKADGPERIYGEWWKHLGEADSVRDYFRVEDESGARFWLFRRGDGLDPRTGDLSWYIHGVFG